MLERIGIIKGDITKQKVDGVIHRAAGSEYENIFMMRDLTHGSIDSSHNLIPHRRFYKWCRSFLYERIYR